MSMNNMGSQLNTVGFVDLPYTQNYWPVKFSQIPAPTTTVLMGETSCLDFDAADIVRFLGIWRGGARSGHMPTPHFGQLDAQNSSGIWRIWINGQANVLFCDGHVEPIHCQKNWLTYDNCLYGAQFDP